MLCAAKATATPPMPRAPNSGPRRTPNTDSDQKMAAATTDQPRNRVSASVAIRSLSPRRRLRRTPVRSRALAAMPTVRINAAPTQSTMVRPELKTGWRATAAASSVVTMGYLPSRRRCHQRSARRALAALRPGLPEMPPEGLVPAPET